MADNTLQTGTDTIATDDLTTLNGGAVSNVKVQRVKVGFGSDASLRDVDSSNGLPVSGNSSAANIAATTNTGISPVIPYAAWSITHLPATATKATISKAAGAAGVRHVCTGFIASIAC